MDRSGRQTAERWVAQQGRLSARLHKTRQLGPRGLHSLNLDPRRDAWVYVPPSYEPDHPAPLVLALHGAGGKALHHMGYLRPLADEHGLVLLGPTSREDTWDVIRGEYGPDILFIDRSLEETFDSYAIAPGLIAVEGFSDGASYALSIGLANGDLFTHILAFSPGFMAPLVQQGDPRIFISHGASDPVLRIDVCSRRLVPRLELAGYRVRFVEFSGGHTVPQDLAEDAVAWFLDESGPAQQASGDVR